jgi:UDP:flavonoid glycosyltransferase YjiC (YdhE family)
VRVLQVIWEGGGNTAPQLAIARALVARGHEVRILGHRCQRERIEAAGAEYVPYRQAPEGDSRHPDTDILRDWEARTPIGAFARVRDRVMYGPAGLFARDVIAALDGAPADLVAWDYLLLGGGVGAERAGVPNACVVHTVYPLPAPGVPPFGLGLLPARGVPGRLRDAALARVFRQSFRPGLAALNLARGELGLPALDDPFGQIMRADRVLVLTSAAFDYAGTAELPGRVRFAGAVTDGTSAASWDSPWAPGDARPLVLASFSTTFMDQGDLLKRAVAALGELPVRGLVTTGPAVDADGLAGPENVAVVRFAPHGPVLREASLVVTHAGMGTVHAALAAGVPLVCMPGGRDQNDVAARVAFHGAGIRLGQGASARKLRDAISRALADRSLAEGAKRLSQGIAAEDGAARAADELEALAARRGA